MTLSFFIPIEKKGLCLKQGVIFFLIVHFFETVRFTLKQNETNCIILNIVLSNRETELYNVHKTDKKNL